MLQRYVKGLTNHQWSIVGVVSDLPGPYHYQAREVFDAYRSIVGYGFTGSHLLMLLLV